MSTPELELSEDETKKFAAWMAKVSNLYDDRLNPKYVLWVEGALLLGGIYGPRAIAINARWNTQQKNQRRPINIPTAAPPVVQPIDGKRPVAAAGPVPRSPVEMFGDLHAGASLPEVV